jgi:hypothetical protein
MDDGRIEAALRAGRPDEPQYRGDIAELLRARATSPSEPDQVGHDILLVTRQPRRQPRWPAFAGAAAASFLLLVGLATIARRDAPPPASIPTTTSEAPPSSTIPGTLPPELIDRWVGATPSPVSTPNPSAPAFVVFTAGQVSLEHLSGGIVNDFTSDVAVAGPGELVLTLTTQIGRCAAGATGDYRWTVSPQATTLTLEAIDDACPDRAATLAGTWTHTACPTQGNDCLGILEAGTYASVNFDPFNTDSYGQVTYTVSNGWTSTVDDKDRLALLPPDEGEQGEHGVYLFADVAATTTDCPATPAATIGMDAIADAITSTPGLVATTAVAEVGGYQARTIDITATDLSCDGEASLLASRPGAVTSWSATINDGQQMRIVLVDLTDDRTLALVISSDRPPAAHAALLDDAAAVIESLVFSEMP